MDTTNETPCPQCGKTIAFSELDEHADWHVAQNLQAEFEAEGSSSQPAPISRPPVQDHRSDIKDSQAVPPVNGDGDRDVKGAPPPASAQFAPPSYPPPSSDTNAQFAPPSYPPPSGKSDQQFARVTHTNAVIEAGKVRAKDEQQMQNALQSLQLKYNIWNSDIEPEHDTEYYCGCPIHQYKAMKWRRYGVQDMWSKAVMYPGEKGYNDNTQTMLITRNPYTYGVVSPFGNSFNRSSFYTTQKPVPSYYTQSIHQTINLNNRLNVEAQRNIDAIEPKFNIWDDEPLDAALANLNLAEKASDKKAPFLTKGDRKDSGEPSSSSAGNNTKRSSKMFGFKKALGIRSSEEKSQAKVSQLRAAILDEEDGRWPDQRWREIVMGYQEKVGMAEMIADLRMRRPTQYLHLLRAGYFEPIPTAWATQNSNPLKFSIEAAAGWRGITPAWRGYEDTAEERLYWVLNHRKGSVGARLKPDFISEMEMARARMATAVEPPPEYFSPSDTCHVQHTSTGYSKQVMPPPFVAYDRPETAADDTMILLDVSGSMDFDPLRPIYNQYLVVGYDRSTQPKNKHVAKAIIRRFTDAMSNHDHSFGGYDLVTFANQAQYIGCVNHANLERMWQNVRIGGGTRVMTGWQKVKEMHFQKHSESAVHHPVYGWQAGPKTPILRLLLLLDGEATDMDEFELDLLGLSWAHVTIFLIGVDGCPHHHRHANELARISAVNHHVSFVDAQGNMPERFVTHELLKRHLGYELSIQEFQEIEELPAYSET